jgi:hypothetical protein
MPLTSEMSDTFEITVAVRGSQRTNLGERAGPWTVRDRRVLIVIMSNLFVEI